jgi:thiamine monophosphate synthase
MSEDIPHTQEEDEAKQLDPSQVQYLQQRLESEQNLPLAAIGGIGAALVGAAVWAGITVVSWPSELGSS